MAKVTIHKVNIGITKVPVGAWIYLSHSEACQITSGIAKATIIKVAGLTGKPWAAIAAAAIVAQLAFIRSKNVTSGGKGVKLYFSFATGLIMSVERRGKGKSPCP